MRPVAADSGGPWVEGGWYLGDDQFEDGVAQFPPNANILRPISDWEVRKGSKVSNQSAWPWRWTLELATGDLRGLLKQRALFADNGPLLDEALWVLALALEGRGSLSNDPIPLEPIRNRLNEAPPNVLFELRGRLINLDPVKRRLSELAASADVVRPPWPPPDREQGGGAWVWSIYSPARQVERLNAVFKAAIDAYRDVTLKWLPRIAPRLQKFATLPARLVGNFQPGTDGPDGWPVLQWYLEPVSPGKETQVDIQIRPASASIDDLRSLHQRVVRERPEAAGWIDATLHNGLTNVFDADPATEIVYDWLKADLQRIRWAT